MRQIALDVHQGFCEIAIREDGQTRSAGRVATSRASLELFADSLCPSDEVVMEATGPAMEIARIISPRVVRVVVANAQDVRAISPARVKSRSLRRAHAGGAFGGGHAGPGVGARS